MSTKPVVAAGATSLGWTQTGINRSAQVVAAFAPAIAGDLTDQDVYLLKAGSPVGSNHASTAAWSTSDATESYGSSSDLWGTTWTPAQINASNFGVRLNVRNTSATASNTAYVDYIEITVRYSPDTTTGIGSSGANITRADIGGTCTYNGGTPHTPCTSADRVYAGTITTAPANLVKPTIDMTWWWQNAKPGPKHYCTEAGQLVPRRLRQRCRLHERPEQQRPRPGGGDAGRARATPAR